MDDGTELADDDGDGFAEVDGDCHDGDPQVSPADPERDGNGVDDDCNGLVDETGIHGDADGDGWSTAGGDCDDTDADRSPDAVERDNGVDDDCDGTVDEDFVDIDGDGYAVADGDCNDAEGWSRPGLTETCDGIDNDCDDLVDEGCSEPATASEPADSASCGHASQRSKASLALLVALAAAFRRRHSQSLGSLSVSSSSQREHRPARSQS